MVSTKTVKCMLTSVKMTYWTMSSHASNPNLWCSWSTHHFNRASDILPTKKEFTLRAQTKGSVCGVSNQTWIMNAFPVGDITQAHTDTAWHRRIPSGNNPCCGVGFLPNRLVRLQTQASRYVVRDRRYIINVYIQLDSTVRETINHFDQCRCVIGCNC